jgi:hypothetical protein
MEEWQQQETTSQSSRLPAVAELLAREDEANADYMAGHSTRDKWLEQLRDIDDKLSIVGLRLARLDSRPGQAKF